MADPRPPGHRYDIYSDRVIVRLGDEVLPDGATVTMSVAELAATILAVANARKPATTKPERSPKP